MLHQRHGGRLPQYTASRQDNALRIVRLSICRCQATRSPSVALLAIETVFFEIRVPSRPFLD